MAKKLGEINMFGKYPVSVYDHIDWSEVSFIMCSNSSHFDDDVRGFCHECEEPIVYRPYQPVDVKKVCLDCAGKLAKEKK